MLLIFFAHTAAQNYGWHLYAALYSFTLMVKGDAGNP